MSFSSFQFIGYFEQSLIAHVLDPQFFPKKTYEIKRFVNFNKGITSIQLCLQESPESKLKLVANISSETVPQQEKKSVFNIRIQVKKKETELLLVLVDSEYQLKKEALRMALLFKYHLYCALQGSIEGISPDVESRDEKILKLQDEIEAILPKEEIKKKKKSEHGSFVSDMNASEGEAFVADLQAQVGSEQKTETPSQEPVAEGEDADFVNQLMGGAPTPEASS